tara:strand:+ start:194 stop:919 length:726 start_codon:yes stop_codon:yes gene_type:complete
MTIQKKKENSGDNIKTTSAGWTFGENVPKNFTSHVSKSVPLYDLGQELILEYSEFFVSPNETVYDVGCSTGVLTAKLADKYKDKNVTIVGIDIEHNMINQAKKENNRKNIKYTKTDVIKNKFKKTNLIACYYTIQFTPPKIRQEIFNKLYESLNWGGALLMFEKVRAPDARFQDYSVQIYNEYKLKSGYDEINIVNKSRSLKRVLEPFSSEANYELMRRSGFKDIMTIQKYVCFEGFLAIK